MAHLTFAVLVLLIDSAVRKPNLANWILASGLFAIAVYSTGRNYGMWDTFERDEQLAAGPPPVHEAFDS